MRNKRDGIVPNAREASQLASILSPIALPPGSARVGGFTR